MANLDGMNTLGFPLDALIACENRYRDYHLVVAVGSIATAGVTRERFIYDPAIHTLGELVEVADKKLGVAAGLITVIRSCKLGRHVYPDGAESSDLRRFEALQSIILEKEAGTPVLPIVRDRQQKPAIAVNENGLGEARTRPAIRRKGPYNLQFAPFDSTYPPDRIIEARRDQKAPTLYVAGTGLELIETADRLDEALQAHMQ